jgi:glycosyltransferase involved in cell wall biosynthesis
MRQGLDTSNWRPRKPGDSAKARDGLLRVGYIGQLTPHKGVFDLVGAVRRLHVDTNTLHLSLHGDPAAAWPAHRQQLERAMAGDARITLAGPFDNRDIRNVHAGLDVLVVPSRWYENSPNVILEAFACGTPVITANLGGMAELVEDGVNGLLFEPGDVEDLARCLRRVAEEPELLDRLRAGIPPVRTIEEEMDELLALYDEVAAERRTAQPAGGVA